MSRVWEYEPNLEYQTNAVKSVVSLFEGEDKKEYDPIKSKKNNRNISKTKMKENLIKIQKSQWSNVDNWDDEMFDSNMFTIEMETGTGKTYVYLKTMLELHENYGFNKFILVVPSRPIMLGVEKTIQQLYTHFLRLYNIDLLRSYFVYDSQNGGASKINQFIESTSLQIVVMTNASFNKDNNILNKVKEDGVQYWNLLKGTNPIVFIDEPQRVLGDKMKKSKALLQIEELDPLAIFLYSATHKQYFNRIYKLDSFDAFEKDLVKGINVSTIYSDVDKNFPYFRYVSFNSTKLEAKIEVLVSDEVGVRLKKIDIDTPCNLYEKTNLEQYRDFKITKLPHKQEGVCANFYKEKRNSEYYFSEGECNYHVYEDDMTEIQIKITIKKHLDKQIEMLKYNVKVLSLFFIDEVGKYRDYTKEGASGEYVKTFEKLYQEVVNSDEKYQQLLKNMPSLVNEKKVHEGYFAIDKNQKIITDEKIYVVNEKAKTKEEINIGIQKILSGKEQLIQLEEPISFIFAHSALAEGWDNPNVFQLCMLRKTNAAIRKKQEIGRGLRLARKSGEHSNIIRDKNVNQLTVIVNEHYEEFASNLQKEYNEDANYDKEAVTLVETKKIQLLIEKSIDKNLSHTFFKKLHKELIEAKFIKEKDNKLNDKKMNKLEFHKYEDTELNDNKDRIFNMLRKVMKEKGSKKVRTVNADEVIENSFQKYVEEADFKKLLIELEKRLNKKTIYEIKYNEEVLIQNCIDEANEKITNKELIITERTGQMNASIRKNGFEVVEQKGNEHEYEVKLKNEDEKYFVDIVNEIMRKTNFTRQAIYKIIMNTKNPMLFQKQDNIERLISIIQTQKKLQYHENRNGIQYQLINETNDIGIAELFLRKNVVKDDEKNIENKNVFIGIEKHKKAVCKYFTTDSDGEYDFAEHLENDENVILYSKINKGSFVIDNPIENYSPDWAIVYNTAEGTPKIYLIMETKWDKEWTDLTPVEQTKIVCAKKHFQSLDENIEYDWVNAYNDFKEKVKK